MNFDPLPDADNAAVGSHNDFFRRHQVAGVSFYIRNNLQRQQCSVRLGAPLSDAI